MKLQFLIFACIIFKFSTAILQNVTVRGVTFCNKKPVAKVDVRLVEKDIVGQYDTLNRVRTNEMGEFEVFGEKNEYFSITPILQIIHRCNTEINCLRTSTYVIPEKFVGSVYDMNLIALDLYDNDETYCHNLLSPWAQ
ncbi:unnamed protein product [Caenorhabditis angaria]|uniref:Uncharacterized protein n=1 Tax=Caenorhabditis angaria TaxID=860376 RepID=A0A9P1IFI9_9PELO|nr:unnamed protein product [Caenorhabditis angaria]